MGMRLPVCVGIVVLASGLLSSCASGNQIVSDCVSRYDVVASAPTSKKLETATLAYAEQGPVASLRTQARGDDVGAGDQDAVRVVDLLDRSGRRLVQVDIWRTDAGAWRAGAWQQCID